MCSDNNTPQPKSILVFANGSIPGNDLLKSYLGSADMIVCADGGANKVIDLGIKPDVIVGDLDSVSKRTLESLEEVTIVRRPEQDSTDLQKTLEYIESKVAGDKTIYVFGATGERVDHLLGNISLLRRFYGKLDIELVDTSCSIRYFEKDSTLSGTPGQIVSLFALHGSAGGVSTKGLKFNLEDESLEQGTRGISNELAGPTVHITVREGGLIVIIQHVGMR
jgi:thiamine pyrophosphokinase